MNDDIGMLFVTSPRGLRVERQSAMKQTDTYQGVVWLVNIMIREGHTYAYNEETLSYCDGRFDVRYDRLRKCKKKTLKNNIMCTVHVYSYMCNPCL